MTEPRDALPASITLMVGITTLFAMTACKQVDPTLDDWPCTVDSDCIEGLLCSPTLKSCVSCIDNDGDGYGTGSGCAGTDCNDSVAACTSDCT